MDGSLRELLAGLVDYAGLFPPAKLDLEPALDNFLRYRQGDHGWMLGRFICPVGQLYDLAQMIESRRSVLTASSLPLSVILTADTRVDDALDGWESEGAAIHAFESELGGLVEIESVEARLPDELIAETDGVVLEAFFHATMDRCERQSCRSMPFFWERTLLGDFNRGAYEALVDALARISGSRLSAGQPPWGLKLRCGGVTPEAFPEARIVAAAIVVALRHGVPFKATAGLHHPLRRRDDELGVQMQGFLNVFGGAVVAVADELDEGQLWELLEEESVDSFFFDGGVLSLKGHRVPLPAVRRIRKELVRSFGSCSFDEPRDDLAALGLLGGS